MKEEPAPAEAAEPARPPDASDPADAEDTADALPSNVVRLPDDPGVDPEEGSEKPESRFRLF